MSESEEHRRLVLEVVKVLDSMYPNGSTIVDIQRVPGDDVPPRIGAFRPDVYLRSKAATVIAEAKTDKDLDRRHTYDQVVSYMNHLERSTDGFLVLSVTGYRADFAKTVLRFAHRDVRPSRTKVAVFDQCDLWLLQPNGVTWAITSR